ncbi:MAG TPA: alkaline phosphatase family protein [Methylomirabilota bacterium]|jgi:predicted AlkP superfamily phosphohydrolase/phosphomutase|nr:alkaline phosphatase family protein [Methylomirabilota bacterium]
MLNGRKVAVIGLDCAAPRLVFDDWRRELPHLNELMNRGSYGPLESCHPPITVPAWSVMTSSKDPGQLGFYGFRNRRDHSYDSYAIASSKSITHDRVWDILSRAGKRVILLGVPQTYPPQPVNGSMVTCFLTPSNQSRYTHPPELREEIERVSGGYIFDVEGFRTGDKGQLLNRIYDKTRKHFTVARHLVKNQPWDFFMMVEMGVDRIHHGFWDHMDPTHPKYEAGNPYEEAIRTYYRHVDAEVGELLALMPDDTVVLVVSDHGAKKMDGAVCINEWLIERGQLALAAPVRQPTQITQAPIDWARTRAWGDGGYYGRLFFNVKGREPQGTIAKDDYERFRTDMIAEIEALPGPDGKSLGSKAHRPEELYRECRGVAPDLIVYFGNLDWRSVGSVGIGSTYTFDNDTGPDGANHDWHGISIFADPSRPAGGRKLEGLRLVDIAPTVLDLFGLPIPEDMTGRVVAAA